MQWKEDQTAGVARLSIVSLKTAPSAYSCFVSDCNKLVFHLGEERAGDTNGDVGGTQSKLLRPAQPAVRFAVKNKDKKRRIFGRCPMVAVVRDVRQAAADKNGQARSLC